MVHWLEILELFTGTEDMILGGAKVERLFALGLGA